jgi:hypothetical protein
MHISSGIIVFLNVMVDGYKYLVTEGEQSVCIRRTKIIYELVNLKSGDEIGSKDVAHVNESRKTWIFHLLNQSELLLFFGFPDEETPKRSIQRKAVSRPICQNPLPASIL